MASKADQDYRLALLNILSEVATNPNSDEATRKKAAEGLASHGFSLEKTDTGYRVSEKAPEGAPAAPVRTGSLSSRAATPVGGSQKRERSAFMKTLLERRATSPDPAIATDARNLLGGRPQAAAAPQPQAASAPVQPGQSAYSLGAPSLDDRADAYGRPIAGAQSFVRGLFDASNNAQKALSDYEKANFGKDLANDATAAQLRQAASGAAANAGAGSQWAALSPSKRQSILTQGEIAASRAYGLGQVQQQALEQRQAAQDQGKDQPSLLEDLDYQNQTGVLRGGAGVGTSVTAAGGVISAPDNKTGARTLTSPYGSGSATTIATGQPRPEAMIEGIPASQYFDKAAMRQGRTFTVGNKQYSPELPPQELDKKKMEEEKRLAAQQRRGFATSVFKR